MIIKEWHCRDCDSYFESADADPTCPTCAASEPARAFLTPPGFKTPKTAFKDTVVKDLAAAHGLSDMSNKEGAVINRPRGQVGPEAARARWGGGAELMSRAAAVPQGIVDGMGFTGPKPLIVARAK